MYVFNDLGFHIFVEAAYDWFAFHHEVLFDSRGGYLHVKHLIFDEDVLGVLGYNFAHDDGPSLDDAVLVVGGLNAIDAHEHLDEFAYLFWLSAFHWGEGVLCGMMGLVFLFR